MIKLRYTDEKELQTFTEMELQKHAKKFVNNTDLKTHKINFKKTKIIYLSIDNSEGKVSGYFILVHESDIDSIEFQRIVVDENCRGIGQIAIKEMEGFCEKELKAKRIWLDVYEDNLVGQHIYEKLGYIKFREGMHDGRKLLFYQKNL